MLQKLYKGVTVGKNSALADAIEQDEALKRQGKSEEAVNAKKVFAETSERFEALYGKEDTSWFYGRSKQ
jgi:hypothetical protein